MSALGFGVNGFGFKLGLLPLVAVGIRFLGLGLRD